MQLINYNIISGSVVPKAKGTYKAKRCFVKGNKNGKEKESKEKREEGKLDYKRNEPAEETVPEDGYFQNSQETWPFDRHGEEKSVQNGSLQGEKLPEIHRQSIGLRNYLRKAM